MSNNDLASYCKEHQGSTSHHAPHNCDLCCAKSTIESQRATILTQKQTITNYQLSNAKYPLEGATLPPPMIVYFKLTNKMLADAQVRRAFHNAFGSDVLGNVPGMFNANDKTSVQITCTAEAFTKFLVFRHMFLCGNNWRDLDVTYACESIVKRGPQKRDNIKSINTLTNEINYHDVG